MSALFDHPAVGETLFGGECGPPLPSTDREHPVDFDLDGKFGEACGSGLYMNCAAHAPALLVLLSGVDACAEQAAFWDRWGCELRVDILLVDYPGVGAAIGPASISAAQATARQALTYLINRPSEEVPGVVILGRGLGAALAVDALVHVPSDRVRGLILETGPADLVNAYGSQIDWAKVPDADQAKAALRKEFDLRQLLTGLQVPLLVLHPQQDAAFPLDHGERLAQWGGGKLVILGRGNRDDVPGLNEAEYRRELHNFLESYARFEEGGGSARPGKT
ncbi:MAG: alpha/beta hydrolase [Planctomycetes bacterium]|nr:alpha/beta hydrolase [Planctomycetota bacterium]